MRLAAPPGARLALCLLVFAGCTEVGAPGSSADADPDLGRRDVRDLGRADAAPPDLGRENADGGGEDAEDFGPTDAGEELSDAAHADAALADGGGPSDGGAPEVGAPDGGRDGGPADLGALDAGGCGYALLDSSIVECPSGYVYARTFRARPPSRTCPDFIQLGANRYPDLPSAVRGEGCRSGCIWSAFRSVSFVDHCGRRNGYILFRASDPRQCLDLYEFSNGIFDSVAAWEAATPC